MALRRHLLAALALVVLAPLAHAGVAEAAAPGNGRCRLPADASVIDRSASALLYTRPAGPEGLDDRLDGCLKTRGVRFPVAYLGASLEDGRTRLVRQRLTGRFAAVATEGSGGASRRRSSIVLRSVDLRTGRRARGIEILAAEEERRSDTLRDLAVNTSGDLGWAIDRYRPGTAQGDGTQAGQGVFGEVHALDARGDVLLDSGPEGAFSDLRLYGRFIAWATPDGRRSAPLAARPAASAATVERAGARPAATPSRSDGRCRLPADATVVLRTRQALVYTRDLYSEEAPGDHTRVAACLKSRGDRRLLQRLYDGAGFLRAAQAGRFVVLAQAGGRTDPVIGFASYDLDTGALRRSGTVDGGPTSEAPRVVVTGLAVNPSGDFGWSADIRRVEPQPSASPVLVARSEVHAVDGRGDVMLDRGAERAFGDVRMYGRSISWSAPGGRRAAALTR